MDIEQAKKLADELNWSHFDMSEDSSKEYIDAVQTVLSELEKKEAIINEMARYIDKITEEIAREKGVEDFEFCDNKCTDKDEYIDCKECIKQYFENKAEEDE